MKLWHPSRRELAACTYMKHQMNSLSRSDSAAQAAAALRAASAAPPLGLEDVLRRELEEAAVGGEELGLTGGGDLAAGLANASAGLPEQR